MIRYDGEGIVLSEDTSLDFLRNAFNPPSLEVRPYFSQITITRTGEGFFADIPDLVIPNKSENELYCSYDAGDVFKAIRQSSFFGWQNVVFSNPASSPKITHYQYEGQQIFTIRIELDNTAA